MKLLSFWLTLLTVAAISQPSHATTEEHPLSTYTKQLIDLIGVWDKLNQTVADRINADERHLLANAMLRISSGFYALKVSKHDFVESIRGEPADGSIDYTTYSPIVEKQQAAVQCFINQLNQVGARLTVLEDIHGADVDNALRTGLDAKVADLRDIARQLKLPHGSEDVEALKQRIIDDADKAVAAAALLGDKSQAFAHVLDPSATLQGQPPCGAP